MQKRLILLTIGISLLAGLLTSPVQADHSWNGYHWARTANPFTLVAAENLSSTWEPYLQTTASDWSLSSVLDINIVTGSNTPKRCKPTSGRLEVCNSTYGNNGWLGIAQIWITGDHITSGITKVNDTYFNKPQYNTPAWRNLVMCQEVGHTLGLDHQDENFSNSNLGTCMDYTSNPESNQHPNVHDYEELETIYTHLDSITTVGAFISRHQNNGLDVDHNNPSQWGQLMKETQGVAVYERDFGNNEKLVTFVIKAL